MATVPTSSMETELRKLFLRWSAGLPNQTGRMDQYLNTFRRDSLSLINKMGGDISRLGVSAGFPAPKELDLDLVAGHIYDQMQLAVVRAQIMTGLNARESARALLKAGVGKEYYKLERLARTETVRAYWNNQWNEAEDLGLVLLWSAERGPRTCKWCLERDGMVVPSRLVRDHPNGRCTMVPTLPSRVKYRGSVANDGSIFNDPDWDAEFKPVAPFMKEGPVKRALTPYSLDKKVFALETNDLNIIGARAGIVDNHDNALAALAKAKKREPEALREEINKKMQDFVDKGKPVIHVEPDNLESILQKGFQSTWENELGIGAGTGREDYLKLREAAEAMNWKNQRPIYGMIDDGGSKGMLYGNVQVVLKDSVKDGATVTFGDSLNYGANMLASPARQVDVLSIRDDYLHKNNFSRGYSTRDLVSEYAELQMPSVSAQDIDSIVVMYWEGQDKPSLSDAVMALLKERNISVTWKEMR